MSPGVVIDRQTDAADRGDPWLDLLLGCISWARQVEGGGNTVAAATASDEDPAAARLLDAWLGIVALGHRFDERIAAWWTPAPGQEQGGAPAPAPRDLLR